MKKVVCSFLCVLMLFTFPVYAKGYSARSMVVMEHTTLSVLDGINSDKKMPMASTTKIMTALVTLDNVGLSQEVVIPREATGIEGSSMYLVCGETLTVEELLYGLMLTSGNDAAVALSIAVAGSQSAFVDLMNKKANELGLKSTNFTNPSGLPDENHYTTAFELGKITAAALENATFSKIVSTKSIRVPYKNNKDGRLLTNHNKLLSLYDYAIGVKTGFTKKAGRCLVSAAKKDGVTLICVTLNAPDDWNDHISAYNSNFKKVGIKTIAKKGEVTIKLATSDGKTVYASNPEDILAVGIDGKEYSKTVLAELFIYAPKAKGQTVASVCYKLDGVTVASSPLCIDRALNIKVKKHFFITKILDYIKGLFK